MSSVGLFEIGLNLVIDAMEKVRVLRKKLRPDQSNQKSIWYMQKGLWVWWKWLGLFGGFTYEWYNAFWQIL